MMPLLFALPGAQRSAAALLDHWPCQPAQLDLHRFPDQECRPCFGAPLEGRDVVLVAQLDQPDAKLFELYLCASTARELGAASVGLVLPYLPYMRQDCRFEPGQGTSARHMAALLSSCADWLVTVDPHLHRFHKLDQVFSIPATVVASAGPVAQWIRAQVAQPVVVGPDSESAQWVSQVAALAQCPYAVMDKTRYGDREVEVALAAGALAPGRVPVLLDDIISSGRTMAAAIARLRAGGTPPPVCVVVHPLFAGDALAVLQAAAPARIVSCNAIEHASNGIDVSAELAQAAAALHRSHRR
jgi:ribose-phosphate pyrophosphokinase